MNAPRWPRRVCLFAHRSPSRAGSITRLKRRSPPTSRRDADRPGQVLQGGGNAADAAVAVALALAVVSPQAGNLGGGGFRDVLRRETRGVWTLDFRETSPLAAAPNSQETRATGAARGGRSGHRRGPRGAARAVRLAAVERTGRPCHRPGSRGTAREDPELRFRHAAAKTTPELDAHRRAPCRRPSRSPCNESRMHGARDFYHGRAREEAQSTDLRAAGGVVGFRDLREYSPSGARRLKLSYGRYEIYSVAPPSGGGLVIGETLNILATDDLAAPDSRRPLPFTCSSKRSAARHIDAAYLGDPANTRFLTASCCRAARPAVAQDDRGPCRRHRRLRAPRSLAEGDHTTHFTIADAAATSSPSPPPSARFRQRLSRPFARLLPQRARNADFGVSA